MCHCLQCPAGSRIQPQLQIAPTTSFMPWKMTMTRMHLVPQHGCCPCYPHQCQEHQLNVHPSHLSNRPLPCSLSLTSLLLQVGPVQPHNQAHCHFQGCLYYRALLLIAQGHVLHHCTTVFWLHWYNTISLPPKQHGPNTPWPPNLPAYAKHWRFWHLN